MRIVLGVVLAAVVAVANSTIANPVTALDWGILVVASFLIGVGGSSFVNVILGD